MAKKSANPADAHRKAQRQKELKRNKENRTKTREVATLKKDTGGLEARIRTLSALSNRSKADEQELTSLKSELEYTTKLKREYVEKHPEHRKFVYAREVAAEEEKARLEKEAKGEGTSGKGLYDAQGRLRRPERSLYYDPVLNPYGAPPPGMPYRERPPTPEPLPAELQSESESESSSDDSDDDLLLPPGPPPGTAGADASGSSSDDDDSDDDVIFPSGPPPPKPVVQPPLPPGPPPPPGFNVPPPGFDPRFPPPGFFPPPQQQQQHVPYQPQAHPAMLIGGPMPPQMGFYGRPPAPALHHQQVPHGVHVPYRPGGGRPGQPRGARPPAARRPPPSAAASGSDAAVPTGPSASGSAGLPAKPHSLPANPTQRAPPPPPPAGVSALDALAAASTAAAPVLRDFKAEAAAFVPAAVKKRRKAEEARAAKRVKSAPDVDIADAGGVGAYEPLEGFDTPLEGYEPLEGYAPLEGYDDPAPPPPPPPPPPPTAAAAAAAAAAPPPRIVPKAAGPVSFGGANNPLLGGLASALGKAGFVPKKPAPAPAPAAAAAKKVDKDGYEGFLKGLDGLEK